MSHPNIDVTLRLMPYLLDMKVLYTAWDTLQELKNKSTIVLSIVQAVGMMTGQKASTHVSKYKAFPD